MIDTSKIYKSKASGEFRVIEYKRWDNILIEFLGTGYRVKTRADSIKNGSIKDRLLPSVHGVGFHGEGSYMANKGSKPYQLWVGMLERCYSVKLHAKRPTYKDCTVCDEWHNFQNFAKWFDENYIKGFELDKDVKITGNKVYSPCACLFVSAYENAQKALARLFIFTSPKGELVHIYNLSKFCRENELSQGSMSGVYHGKLKHHKGWTKE